MKKRKIKKVLQLKKNMGKFNREYIRREMRDEKVAYRWVHDEIVGMMLGIKNKIRERKKKGWKLRGKGLRTSEFDWIKKGNVSWKGKKNYIDIRDIQDEVWMRENCRMGIYGEAKKIDICWEKQLKHDTFGSTVLAVHHLQGWRRACWPRRRPRPCVSPWSAPRWLAPRVCNTPIITSLIVALFFFFFHLLINSSTLTTIILINSVVKK